MLYFDHNATTPLAPEVASVFAGALQEYFGNASSMHRHGQRARQQLEQSRKLIAESMGASPAEFVFTSGGTESNNLALFGVLRKLRTGRKHVITSAIEHPAVSEALRAMQVEGVEVSSASVDSDGVVDVSQIESLLRPETVLVSVMHANNETGALQPIEEIAAAVRARRAGGQQIYLHSDGVQAFGKVPVDLQRLGVDLYSVSGHKIFAPKGIGGLYVRSGVSIMSHHFGGRHERSRRAGTENVPAAIALARAVELCQEEDWQALSTNRNRFESLVCGSLGAANVRINGPKDARLPNTSNLEFCAVPAEALVISLDMEGLAVSTGSACSSGSIDPSHVLLAMGRSREQAKSSVRFSFGRYNTARDLKALVAAVRYSVQRLQSNGQSYKDRRVVLH